MAPATTALGSDVKPHLKSRFCLQAILKKRGGAMLECEIDGPANSSARTMLTAQGIPGQCIYGARDTRSICLPPHNACTGRTTQVRVCETDRPTLYPAPPAPSHTPPARTESSKKGGRGTALDIFWGDSANLIPKKRGCGTVCPGRWGMAGGWGCRVEGQLR